MTLKPQNERLAVVENNILHIGQGVQDIKLMLKEHIDNEKEFITKVEADMRYASKETERGFAVLRKDYRKIMWAAVMGLVSIVAYFVKLLIEK
jgi:hypothetical protein